MILVFDIGTTTVKGAAFSRQGALIRKGEKSINLYAGTSPLMHEQDPHEWTDAVKELSPVLCGEEWCSVEAVAVSGNGPTLVPVSGAGRPLSRAMTWMDRRGSKEAELIFQKTGIRVDPSFYFPKVLWLMENDPGTYESARYFLSCPAFLIYTMTGEAKMDFPGEGLENFIWTDEMIESFRLDKRKFPDFALPGTLAGTVSEEGAKIYKLPQGAPVFIGGPDFVVSLLGTASVKPGRACDRAGTSEGINICSEKPVTDSRLLCYRHVVRKYWNITGIISTSGKAFEWFRNTMMPDTGSYEEALKRISSASSSSEKLIFLPYLTGERAPLWDPNARGVFLGLSLQHGPEEVGYAVLESIGYALRDVLEVMEYLGVVTEELRITGNPGKSDLWNQIKADITGKRILVPETEEPELAGDLCIALAGLKDYSGPGEASEDIIAIKKEFIPDTSKALMYTELFNVYRETYRKLKDLFVRVSQQRQTEEL